MLYFAIDAHASGVGVTRLKFVVSSEMRGAKTTKHFPALERPTLGKIPLRREHGCSRKFPAGYCTRPPGTNILGERVVVISGTIVVPYEGPIRNAWPGRTQKITQIPIMRCRRCGVRVCFAISSHSSAPWPSRFLPEHFSRALDHAIP